MGGFFIARRLVMIVALAKPRAIADSPYRSAKWDELTEGREFSQSDIPLLALLCQWYEVNDTALSEIDTGGEIQTAYTNEMGDIKPLPQLSTMAKASAEIRALSKQLGLFEQREEKQEKPKAKVTAFERIAKQRAQAPARKPDAKVSNSA